MYADELRDEINRMAPDEPWLVTEITGGVKVRLDRRLVGPLGSCYMEAQIPDAMLSQCFTVDRVPELTEVGEFVVGQTLFDLRSGAEEMAA